MNVAAAHPTTVPNPWKEPNAGFGRLEAIGVIRHLSPRESLVFEGDAADCFHRVLRGTIATYKATADGRRQIIAFFYPGDLVGFTAGERFAYGAEAIDRSSVCSVPRAKLGILGDEEPALREGLLSALRREVEAAHERQLWLGRKTARERLACFLLECAGRTGQAGPDGGLTVPLPMSQLEVADYLGLAPETVSRTLAQLARAGAIEVVPPFAGVVVRDRHAIETAAGESAPLPGGYA